MKALRQNYDALTPTERAALCVLALAREDMPEFNRLCDAAPRQWWSIPTNSHTVKAISTMPLLYENEQLTLALSYWFSLGQSALGIIDKSRNAEPDGFDYDLFGLGTAYRYVVNREASTHLCYDVGVEPGELKEDGISGWLLDVCDDNMPRMAPFAKELVDMLAERYKSGAELATVDGVLRLWRATFAEFAGVMVPTDRSEVSTEPTGQSVGRRSQEV